VESFLSVILRVYKHLGYNNAHILNIKGLSLDKEFEGSTENLKNRLNFYFFNKAPFNLKKKGIIVLI